MDAPRKEPDVEPVIPPEVKQAAKFIAYYLEGSVYLSGGALLPHKTRDYDFLVVTQMSDSDLLKYVQALYTDLSGMQKITVREAYQEQEGTWRMVVTVHFMDYKIDILVMPVGYSVSDIMDKYPLSIQKQALWLAGPNLYGTPEVYHQDFTPPGDMLIIVHTASKALEKYQEYYPKHAFLLMPGVKVADG